MLQEMINIARNELANISECIDALPMPQITVLLTDKNNIYTAINDIKGLICEKLKSEDDTKIVQMFTMWKDGRVDLSSIGFRNALIEMNVLNNNTDIILQGKEGYLIKKLTVTLP